MTAPHGALEPAVASAVSRSPAVSPARLDAHQHRLDSLTRIACAAFDVSMASIAIAVDGVDYFVSERGIGMRTNVAEETLCQWVHLGGGPVVISDTTKDDRVLGIPAVVAGMVRFYAGVPLRDQGGTVIGTLCVYSDQPRDVSGDELGLLTDLAVWAEREVWGIEEDLHALRVQSSLLPDGSAEVEGWSVSGSSTPALSLGGDFFDYGVDEAGLHLHVGDVMGKGTGAALLGAGLRALLRRGSPTLEPDLGADTSRLALEVLPDLERVASLITLFRVSVDLHDGSLRFVDAGHGYCVYLAPDGTHEVLSTGQAPFGVFDTDVWTQRESTCARGGRLLVFSDGLLELFDDPDEWSSEAADLLRRHDRPDELISAVAGAAGRCELRDDVTAVALYRER